MADIVLNGLPGQEAFGLLGSQINLPLPGVGLQEEVPSLLISWEGDIALFGVPPLEVSPSTSLLATLEVASLLSEEDVPNVGVAPFHVVTLPGLSSIGFVSEGIQVVFYHFLGEVGGISEGQVGVASSVLGVSLLGVVGISQIGSPQVGAGSFSPDSSSGLMLPGESSKLVLPPGRSTLTLPVESPRLTL